MIGRTAAELGAARGVLTHPGWAAAAAAARGRRGAGRAGAAARAAGAAQVTTAATPAAANTAARRGGGGRAAAAAPVVVVVVVVVVMVAVVVGGGEAGPGLGPGWLWRGLGLVGLAAVEPQARHCVLLHHHAEFRLELREKGRSISFGRCW